jgi:parallel beta-helix repeat protein
MMKNCKKMIVNVIHWQSGGRLFKIQLILTFSLFIASKLYGTTYFVATTGSDSNNGLSINTALKTVKYAASMAKKAGDTVFIKAGLYKNESFMVAGGAVNAPIVFQGYYQKPGDTPNPNYNPSLNINDTLNWNLIPVIDGGANADVIDAFSPYVKIKNIGIKGGTFGIWVWNTHHVTLENVHTTTNGFGNSSGIGLYIHGSNNCIIRNCTVTDAGMVNLIVRNSYNCLVENTKSFAVGWVNDASDYHINFQDTRTSTMRNCQAYNLHPNTYGAPGHGIGIKDEYKNGAYNNPHSTGDSIINCTAYDMGEYFYVAHEAYGNVFLNCTAIGTIDAPGGWSQGIGIRDGAYNNIFNKILVKHTETSVSIVNTVEGPQGVQNCNGNIITNSTFIKSNKGFEIWNANNNTIKNCVFDNVGSSYFIYFPWEMNDLGNTISNSIIINTTGKYLQKNYPSSLSTITSANCDFYNNSFSMPAGTGNISADPLFVDPANGNYHLQSTEGHWDANISSWVTDNSMSPCIDKGLSTDDYKAEPIPNGNIIDMGSYGGTAEASKSSESTGIEIIPNVAEELNIYPNPFSESSTIEYSSPFTSLVTIVLYDIQGKLIRTFYSEYNIKGTLSFQWDGTNSLGQKVNKGLYILNLKTDSGIMKSHKILYK